MAKKLYVGNLAFAVTSEELRTLFAPYGTVQSAQVQVDHETGKSRGFGFVVMADDIEADAAVDLVDGTEHRDRRLNVNVATPKAPPDAGRDPRRPGPNPWSGPRRRS